MLDRDRTCRLEFGNQIVLFLGIIMADWFKTNYPKTNVVVKKKGSGGFDVEDPQLWAEIKEKGSAAIIGMGH
jgi:hypothetical protein